MIEMGQVGSRLAGAVPFEPTAVRNIEKIPIFILVCG
jgi:hypothetical protein